MKIGDRVFFTPDPTNPLRPPNSYSGVVTSIGRRFISVRPDGYRFACLFDPDELGSTLERVYNP